MEENRAEQLFFLWEKISEGEIRLLRVFGEQPVVTVPGFIDGRCVRELGDYCFSRRKLPENEIRYSRYCGGMWESGLSVLKDKEKKEELSADGPYVLYQPDGKTRVISVDKKGKITDTTYAALPEDFTLHVVDHKGRFPFDVKLHPVKRPDWQYRQPEKVFVMSDPHGRLDCVISLLQGNGVIDKNYNWSYGNNHLMVIGDIFDRGKDVPQIFWLFYKLEDEAAKAGGTVSFLLGNHEPLVLANDLRYTKDKYKVLAQKLNMDYPKLFGPDTELGKWLGTRNTMQTIGSDLYVHAGLGKNFYDRNLSIPTVNEEMSKALFMNKKERLSLIHI